MLNYTASFEEKKHTREHLAAPVTVSTNSLVQSAFSKKRNKYPDKMYQLYLGYMCNFIQ